MCDAIFELRQRAIFSPKDSYLGVLRLFLRMYNQQGVSSREWAAGGGQQRVGSEGGGRRTPGAGLAAGREDVRRNF